MLLLAYAVEWVARPKKRRRKKVGEQSKEKKYEKSRDKNRKKKPKIRIDLMTYDFFRQLFYPSIYLAFLVIPQYTPKSSGHCHSRDFQIWPSIHGFTDFRIWASIHAFSDFQFRLVDPRISRFTISARRISEFMISARLSTDLRISDFGPFHDSTNFRISDFGPTDFQIYYSGPLFHGFSKFRFRPVSFLDF
jgi:hypothetical protein